MPKVLSKVGMFFNHRPGIGPLRTHGVLLRPDILDLTYDQWEETHDIIQWMFPLPEKSQFNDGAPLLSADDVAMFHGNELIRDRLIENFIRWRSFLRETDYWRKNRIGGDKELAPNHNHLRITRVLRCLTLLGLQRLAEDHLDYLRHEIDNNRAEVLPNTIFFWHHALNLRGW